MSYQVEFRPGARRDMDRLTKNLQIRVGAKIDALTANPRPPGCVKLSGSERSYRIRIGDYRVVYEIHDDRRVVIIFIIAHRRDVYRGL